jgi:hypothetical protein
MSSIKFNYLTKEMEMEGSESFIESNFNKIQDLLVESLGVQERTASAASRIVKGMQEPALSVKMKESQPKTERIPHELSEVSSMCPVTESSISQVSYELKVKRPPLRKYIRREGMPGHQRIMVEVVEEKPRELSIASLKEKFGLSESKIGGIIRDAEKLGKIKRVMNGSYVWMQD